jgi:YVTN family beta-propeller protein
VCAVVAFARGQIVIEFRVLGSFEVLEDERSLALGGPKQRALLVVLVLRRGEAVSTDRLVDELWGDHAPASAPKIVQGYVSHLRKALGDGFLVTRGRGYLLQTSHGEVDLDRFEALVAEGRRALQAGDPRVASDRLRRALALWRGPPLADFSYEPFAQREIGRLEEERLAALEDRIDADLALGEHAALVGELDASVHDHPLRERLQAQLMLALYRCGRQADALERYQQARRELVEQLGIEPGRALQELERSILEQDPALDPPARPAGAQPTMGRRRSSRRSLALLVSGGALLLAAAVAAATLTSGASSVRLAGDDVGAIATGSGQVALAVPVNSPPTSVAVGKDGAIWVASAAAGTLSRIDPRTHSVAQIPVGRDPVAVTVAPNGSIWVANSGDGTVSRVSPQTDAVVGQPIQVGEGPSALVATSKAIWVANTLDGSVSTISPSTDRVLKTFPVGSEPSGITAGDGSIWVANEGDGTVYQLDPQTGDQVAPPITVGNGPTGIAYGDGAAWVVNSVDGTLSRIDPQSNSVDGTIGVGQGPDAVAVGSSRVWISDEYGNTVAEVDPANLHIVATTSTDSAPLGLALAGARLWVAAAGTGATAHRGGVLRALVSGTSLGGQGDAASIDPGAAQSEFQYHVLTMTSDGLVGWRRVGGVAGNELVPDLAVSLPAPTDNGLTYTFHIRPGIRYSNGVPVRASDFRRGLQRAFRLNDYALMYYVSIIGGQQCLQHPARCDLSRGMVADDATNTLTFHLAQPDPDLLDQLTLPASYPVPPGTPLRPRTRSVPGTGAYEISSYTPAAPHNPRAHGLLVLTRNPYFHQWSAPAQPAGFPNQIVVGTNYTQAEQVTAVKKGRADIAWDGPPPGEVTSLGLNFPSMLHTNLEPETTWLWLNVRSAPFDNLLAREAFNYAVNRTVVSQASTNAFDRGRPACQLLPPNFPGYVRYCPYTEDVARAQALVRQSGTFGDKVTLVTPSQDGRRYARVLAATLREIGYRAAMVEVPANQQYFVRPARFYARFQAGLGNWSADYITASNFFGPLIECSDIATGFNMGGFCSHSLDASIASALSNENVRPGIAAQQWAAIDREVANDAVVVPISNELGWDFVARRVGNYQNNPQLGMLVDQLWVR